MMHITLVVPPSGFQIDERVYPMLGVLKVAAVLVSAGHRVDVLDLSGKRPSSFGMAIYQHHYKHGKSEVYGITVTMPQMPAAVQILADLREQCPASRVILGGAHVTMVNAAAKRGVVRSQEMLAEMTSRFDVVVAGDGERAVFDAIRDGAPSLVDADRPGNVLFLTAADVAESPWPARHLIDLNSYHCYVDGFPATSMIAQLGCPFGCGFCGGRNSPTFRRVRLRPTDDVINEMKHIATTFGYRAFMFLDDELNVSKSYLELLRAMKQAQIDLGQEWRLCGLLKSELFTQDQADLMYEAGFRKLLVGFESGDERILLNMKKGATVDDNTKAVEMAHRAGLKIKALMSIGHPGESAESIAHTTEWLLAVKPDEFDATVLTVYPGTPYHDEAVETALGVWTYTAKNGDRLHAKSINQLTDTPYYKGVPGQYQSYVWTDALSSQDLVRLRDALESDVRDALSIAWPKDAAAMNYEHSMGQC